MYTFLVFVHKAYQWDLLSDSDNRFMLSPCGVE